MSSEDEEDEILEQLSMNTAAGGGEKERKSRGKMTMINKRMDELMEVLD